MTSVLSDSNFSTSITNSAGFNSTTAASSDTSRLSRINSLTKQPSTTKQPSSEILPAPCNVAGAASPSDATDSNIGNVIQKSSATTSQFLRSVHVQCFPSSVYFLLFYLFFSVYFFPFIFFIFFSLFFPCIFFSVYFFSVFSLFFIPCFFFSFFFRLQFIF